MEQIFPMTEANCMLEIKAFLGGGVPGQARLKQILPSLFSYFKIITMDSRARLLCNCGLAPIYGEEPSEVTFFFNPDKTNPLQPGKSVALYRPCVLSDPITADEAVPLEEEHVQPAQSSQQPGAQSAQQSEAQSAQSSQQQAISMEVVSIEALPSPA